MTASREMAFDDFLDAVSLEVRRIGAREWSWSRDVSGDALESLRVTWWRWPTRDYRQSAVGEVEGYAPHVVLAALGEVPPLPAETDGERDERMAVMRPRLVLAALAEATAMGELKRLAR